MGVGVCEGSGVGVSISASVGECMITLIVYKFFIPHPNPNMQDKYEILNFSSMIRTNLPVSVSALWLCAAVVLGCY